MKSLSRSPHPRLFQRCSRPEEAGESRGSEADTSPALKPCQALHLTAVWMMFSAGGKRAFNVKVVERSLRKTELFFIFSAILGAKILWRLFISLKLLFPLKKWTSGLAMQHTSFTDVIKKKETTFILMLGICDEFSSQWKQPLSCFLTGVLDCPVLSLPSFRPSRKLSAFSWHVVLNRQLWSRSGAMQHENSNC